MNKFIKVISQVGSILLIGVFSIWVASFVGNRLNNDQKLTEEIVKDVVKEIIIKRPVCASTLESFFELRQKGQTVTLVKDLNSYAENKVFVKSKIIAVKTVGAGSQVACGYLYINMHTNNGPLKEKWEHPYIKPGEFGGHIIISNAISNNEVDNKTQLLFNLSEINYKELISSSEIRKADWVALFNVTDRIRFDIAFNTLNQTGAIDEISIIYKCWNPETGKETKDCRLTVE